MTKKLTLTIDEAAIEKGKRYAKGTQRSLSELVQRYLLTLGESDETEDLAPKLKSLVDLIPDNQPQYSDEELDGFRREYLEKKHA